MDMPPFEVRKELRGWTLFWARLECVPGSADLLSDMRSRVVRNARTRLMPESLAAHPPIAALRRLFKAAGCDPTRYRPSSEALLRRILKGEELPAIHPLVDINNCLSVEMAVPCCVMRLDSFVPPLVLRSGREGESYVSMRGPLNLAGKPLLADASGPLDAPISGNERVKVVRETAVAWLVAYLPEEAVGAEATGASLLGLLKAAPVAGASHISAF